MTKQPPSRWWHITSVIVFLSCAISMPIAMVFLLLGQLSSGKEFIAPGTHVIPAMTLEEAGVALGNESFKVREDAEQVIRKAALNEYDQVAHFIRSSNPEVAVRARRSLPIVLLGIDDRMPPDLATKLRRIDDFRGHDLEEIVSELARLEPARAVTLIGLHSHWKTRRPDTTEATRKLMDSLEKAMIPVLRDDAVLTELQQLEPSRYAADTLAMILDSLCRLRPDDLSPVLPLHAAWTKGRPQVTGRLNADGYRLELAKETARVPDRTDGMRKLLIMTANPDLTNEQKSAVRKQLASYRDDACRFPVETLDQATGWYFFDLYGTDQGGQAHLDAYRKYRGRFPDIAEKQLLLQPLEALLVLDKAGPGPAMDYAMKQNVHGGMMLLGEWLHAHPDQIRAPLPLPAIKPGQPYPYRTVKFFRIFAPYPDDAEMKQHPEIAAAFEILTKDARWNDVAKQARAIMAQQNQENRPQGQ